MRQDPVSSNFTIKSKFVIIKKSRIEIKEITGKQIKIIKSKGFTA
jgi:hypothetical protein